MYFPSTSLAPAAKSDVESFPSHDRRGPNIVDTPLTARMHHAMPRAIPHVEALHAPHRLELPSLLTQSPDLVAPQIRNQQLSTVQDDLVSVRRLLARVSEV